MGREVVTHIKALIVPWAPPGPLEAADKAEKTKTIAVHNSIPNWLISRVLLKQGAD
jgi:hypothetical protein